MRYLALAAMALAAAIPASAHHSFAVYFDPDAPVTLEGTVTAFRFTNPHGTLVFDVDGEEWRAETNAPVVLRRRGWTRTSLRPGQHVTVSGWRSRDGRGPAHGRRRGRGDRPRRTGACGRRHRRGLRL